MRNELNKNIDFGVIIPLAKRREGDLIEGLAAVIGTSDEAVEETIKAFQKDTDATIIRLDPDQARMEARRFAFSESKWKAPWQPTGPRSNWISEDGSAIQ